MFWTAVAVFGVFIYLIAGAGGRVFRLGYISGSKRDNAAYDRPGFTISGAISLAVDQINRHHPGKLLRCICFWCVQNRVSRFPRYWALCKKCLIENSSKALIKFP